MSESFNSPREGGVAIARALKSSKREEITELYRRQHATKLKAYVTKLKRSWPALTEEQADEICALIRGHLDD